VSLTCLNCSIDSIIANLDNPINQTILSTFMKRKKIKYDVANDGKAAVEKWKTGGFHLILVREPSSVSICPRSAGDGRHRMFLFFC
jgi:hypothetical protein